MDELFKKKRSRTWLYEDYIEKDVGLKMLKRHFSMKAFILSYMVFQFKLRSEVSCASFSFTVGYFAP